MIELVSTMVHELSLTRICKSTSAVKLEPDEQSESSSELLFGESIRVLDQNQQWARIQTVRDGYEGYIPTSAFQFTDVEATHWVSTRATLVFQYPDIKSRVAQRLLFGSELSAIEDATDPEFLRLDNGGFIRAQHCLTSGLHLAQTMVELIESCYLNAPYLWGGRSTDGCDCSGLVQMVARATGHDLPRDSGDQEAALSKDVDFTDRTVDDLVYWPGHVGILQSPDVLLHATAHSMRCCAEPLQNVIKRAGEPKVKRIGTRSIC